MSPSNKKAKTVPGESAGGEYFPGVSKVEDRGTTSPEHDAKDDGLHYRYYDPYEVILGKPMKEWLKFSVCYWHTMRGTGTDPFGGPTLPHNRRWEKLNDFDSEIDPTPSEIRIAMRRIDAFFELLTKLQVEYYTFHDIDVAPEGDSIEESERHFDVVVDYLLEKQESTGIKPLWVTQNLFSSRKYVHGALTSPHVDAYCCGAAQTAKAMDVNAKLGGSNHVFWGGREGYQSLLNADLRKDCDHMAAFFKMVVEYRERKGYDFQLLLEPKPREPMKHQYDYDVQTCLNFLQTYALDDEFMLNVEPNHTTLAGHAAEHDVAVASAFRKLGSVDSNTGDPLLG